MITKTGNLVATTGKAIPGFLKNMWNTVTNAGSGALQVGQNIKNYGSTAHTMGNAYSAARTQMPGATWGRAKSGWHALKSGLGYNVNSQQANAMRTMRNYTAAGVGGYQFGKKVMSPLEDQQNPQIS